MKRFSAVLLSAALLLAAMPFCGIGTVAADDAHDIAYICSHQESGILEYYSCIGDGTAKEPVVTINGLVKDTDFTVAYTANINPGNAKVTVTGIGSYSGTFDAYFEIKKSTDVQADRLFGTANRLRYPGSNRYATSQLVANALKTSLGVSKFEAIIVADGNNYPDALSGGFLAKKKSAPILTVSKAYEKNVQIYIENKLADNGTVYILGGAGVVSGDFENALKDSAV
ncbi:MAG: cell wall-binding repeat-containing protein, partial [Mogibacterium sp.]|nr:cell wall-binding repeat-containing protein [Mogibacterium sp.]